MAKQNPVHIIDLLGGTAQVAADLGVTASVISNWRARGISAAGLYQLRDLAAKNKIALPPNFMASKGKISHGSQSKGAQKA